MKYTDEQLSAYLSGDLDGETSDAISNWIESSDAARQRINELQALEQLMAASLSYEPPADMLYSFREKIIAEREKSANRLHWYQAAAAVLLMVTGFAVGRMTFDSPAPSGEFTDLKHEVRLLQQMVTLNTLRDHTASERLQAINTIERTSPVHDGELVKTLVQTMNSDESPNVRAAAVEALGRFIDQAPVRMEMVYSLGQQENPLVQIAIMNRLIRVHEKAAIGPIQKIAASENAPVEVRHTAQMALALLI